MAKVFLKSRGTACRTLHAGDTGEPRLKCLSVITASRSWIFRLALRNGKVPLSHLNLGEANVYLGGR